MAEKNKKVKIGLIIISIVGIIVIGILIWRLCSCGFGVDSGKGDGEATGNTEAETTVSEQVVETTITTPVIEELEYIEITVSGNEYLYQNSKYTLDDLIKVLTNQELVNTVKITDEKASLKAYETLITALSDNNIHYIEIN